MAKWDPPLRNRCDSKEDANLSPAAPWLLLLAMTLPLRLLLLLIPRWPRTTPLGRLLLVVVVPSTARASPLRLIVTRLWFLWSGPPGGRRRVMTPRPGVILCIWTTHKISHRSTSNNGYGKSNQENHHSPSSACNTNYLFQSARDQLEKYSHELLLRTFYQDQQNEGSTIPPFMHHIIK